MAIIRHITDDVSVSNISERNSLKRKVDGMTVLVADAIADIDAGPGKAVYRYDAADNSFVLVAKSSERTMEFSTEEVVISNGEVQASNIPANNLIWGVSVIGGNVVKVNLRPEDLNIVLGKIQGLSDYNGMSLRFSYAYGSLTSQLNAMFDLKADASEVQTMFDLKADASEVQAIKDLKADASEVQAMFDLKADASEVQAIKDLKADASEVQAMFDLKADASEVQAIKDLLKSNDVNLDSLEEVVSFIKENRTNLQEISFDMGEV